MLEKYATRMGGATNHRMGLWDAAMIKDNHVAVAGGVAEAVRRAKDSGIERIILEVDTLSQIEPGLAAGATHVLLDNMDAATRGGSVVGAATGSASPPHATSPTAVSATTAVRQPAAGLPLDPDSFPILRP